MTDSLLSALWAAESQAKYGGGILPVHLVFTARTACVMYQFNADLFATDDCGATPLHYAACEQFVGEDDALRLLETLLWLGADVNAQDQNNDIAANLAICVDKVVRLQFLIDVGGCNVEFTNWMGTLLQYAAYHTKINVARLLVSRYHVDTERRSENGDTALHAAFRGQRQHTAEVVQLLVEAGADLDSLSAGSFTPLMLAAIHDQPAAAAILLSHGANAELIDRRGRTARSQAVAWEHYDVEALFA